MMEAFPTLRYLSGFGNQHSSEAEPGALPVGQNTPQVCPYGLYAEQVSGSAFTVPRHGNLRTWLYRIRPSVQHRPFTAYTQGFLSKDLSEEEQITPNQLRWSPFSLPKEETHFVDGLRRIATGGDPASRHGIAIYVYGCNTDMKNMAFASADGEMLIVPQLGRLVIQSELGWIDVSPNEIVVIPRGIRFLVRVPDGNTRGYVLEVFDGSFELPDLGPIGANGLANPRDFLYPEAAYEDKKEPFHIIHKFQHQLFSAEQDFSPFDVVAWHGNYAPYKYDLARYCVVNSVSFDHLDPSIFTVLTCRSTSPGTATADFVIFPPRFAVQQHSFRPPYFHRNVMSEFMGLIKGLYEAKGNDFAPGGASLHSCMTPHGPDRETQHRGERAKLEPERVADGTMAFMFETSLMLTVSKWALAQVQPTYYEAWQNIPGRFKKGEPHVKLN